MALDPTHLQPNSQQTLTHLPLVIDLDGTLSHADTLADLFSRCLLLRPISALIALCFLVFRGRAAFKTRLSEHLDLIDLHHLPWNTAVVDYIKKARTCGQKVFLLTAAHHSIAEAVASRHHDLFDYFEGSSGQQNLKGVRKLNRIQELCPNGYIYIGDSPADIPVWHQSFAAGIVASDTKMRKFSLSLKEKNIIFSDQINLSRVQNWIKQLRVHQWTKNILIFVPGILAQKYEITTVLELCAGFLALNILASVTYIVNDILDLNHDRSHPTKKYRPIANGSVHSITALFIALSGIATTTSLMLVWAPEFGFILILYLFISLLYSIKLKSIPLLDVFIIGILFTMRIIGGGVLIDVEISNWLLAISMFLFPSLALAKRQGELVRAISAGHTGSLTGRGYQTDDAPLILSLGVSSGITTPLLLLLYIHFDAFPSLGLYAEPYFLLAIPFFMAIWIGRIWLLAHRGTLDDDPIAFALKDTPSLMLAGLVALSYGLATGHLISFHH